MKKLSILILSLILIIGCQNNHSTRNCIEYIDSLKINLENTTMRVTLIDLVQDYNVRPYSIFFDNYLMALNKKGFFYVFHLDCFAIQCAMGNLAGLYSFTIRIQKK